MNSVLLGAAYLGLFLIGYILLFASITTLAKNIFDAWFAAKRKHLTIMMASGWEDKLNKEVQQ